VQRQKLNKCEVLFYNYPQGFDFEDMMKFIIQLEGLKIKHFPKKVMAFQDKFNAVLVYYGSPGMAFAVHHIGSAL